MKRIVTVVTVLFMALSFSFDTYAVSKNSLSDNSIFINNVSSKNNRLLDIKVGAKSHEILSAGTFIINYDTSVLEFREAKAVRNNCFFECTENTKGTVKGIFLSSKGENIKEGKNLFVLTFKAINNGTGSVKITSEDCVNSSLKNISNLKSGEGSVKIQGKKIEITKIESKNKTDSNENSEKANENNNQSDTLHTDNSSSVIAEKDNGAIFDFDSIASSSTPIIAAVVITTAIICGFSLAFIAGRKKK